MRQPQRGRDTLPTCSSMSFGRSSCSSIVRIARLISSFESFSLGGGGKGELFPAQHHKQLYPACCGGGCVSNVSGLCSAKAQHSPEQPWPCCKQGSDPPSQFPLPTLQLPFPVSLFYSTLCKDCNQYVKYPTFRCDSCPQQCCSCSSSTPKTTEVTFPLATEPSPGSGVQLCTAPEPTATTLKENLANFHCCSWIQTLSLPLFLTTFSCSLPLGKKSERNPKFGQVDVQHSRNPICLVFFGGVGIQYSWKCKKLDTNLSSTFFFLYFT